MVILIFYFILVLRLYFRTKQKKHIKQQQFTKNIVFFNWTTVLLHQKGRKKIIFINYSFLVFLFVSINCWSNRLIASVHHIHEVHGCPMEVWVGNYWLLYRSFHHKGILRWHRNNVNYASVPIVLKTLQQIPWIPSRWLIQRMVGWWVNQDKSKMLDYLVAVYLDHMVRVVLPIIKNIFNKSCSTLFTILKFFC